MEAVSPNVLEIDLNTRIFGETEDIYVVRPGASHSLYDAFQAENAVFLDFPGMVLNPTQKPKNTKELREIVMRAIAIRDFHTSKAETRPSDDLADYDGKASGRRLGRYIGAIERLYYDLPLGTLIVIPSKTDVGDVLFAEITGPVEIRKTVKRYPNEAVMVRPVRWLGRKQRASFKPKLRGLLSRPDPVMQLDRTCRDEVLKAAFKQYVFNDLNSTRLMTSEDDFSILDDLNIQLLTNYVAGLIALSEDDDPVDGNVRLFEALEALEERPYVIPEMDQSISSPGFQRIYGSHISALVIGAVITAALAVPAAAQTPEVRIKNSAMLAADPCSLHVQETYNSAMRLASKDDFDKLCERIKKTKENTGLTTSMSAKTRSSKHKK